MGWVILAAVTWAGGLLVVPQPDFRRLVPFGIITGFGLGFVTNIVGSSIFGLWGFSDALWPILGIPFWSLLAWIPAVIVFVYYLPESALPRLFWLLGFPAAFEVVNLIFLREGLRFFSADWNLVYSYLLSLGLHIFVLSYYLASVRPALPAGTSAREEYGSGDRDRESR